MMEVGAILALAAQCAPQVAPSTIAAIVQTESAGNPYAIGVNSGARLKQQPTNANDARRIAARLLAEGHNIDMGLGQINSSNLGWLELDLRAVFDPCQNLTAAGQVLSHNYAITKASAPNAQTALRRALSMYNTGSPVRGFRNGYVARVLRNANRLRGPQPARRSGSAAYSSNTTEPPTQRVKPEWSVF